jgi:DNA primase
VGIPDEDVAQVRAATDIVALIGEHAALRRQGRRWTGLCPFHSEKTPSFSVNAEEGFYYCFGCQASGDAITFVRATEHLDFVDAVRLLADKAGVVLHEEAGGGAEHRKRTALYEAMERAVSWYHERLLSAPDAGRARDYLRSRGYGGEVVRRFRLGWAPDDWDALSRALGLPERVLTETGLGFVNRRGRTQDSFRARVIFPICDSSGRPVALGGRILPRPEGAGTTDPSAGAARPEPKYKNSPETPIYSKRRTLYGLNWAKHDIVTSGEVVVCEGYTDVIGLFTAGVPRAVATCGTSLTEEHFTLLRNFGRRIVLAYDADGAGQAATERVYEWERRHEVEVAVADLPAGSDPGELARTDPDALRGAIEGARPFLQFRVDRVIGGADLDTAEGRARAADAALAAVAEHPDDLVRDQYVMQIADRCRLDAERLRRRLDEARSGRARPGRHDGPPKKEQGNGRVGDARVRPAASDGDTRDLPPEPWPDEIDDGRPAGRRERPTAASSAGRPGLEALRLAVHRPDAVVDRLDASLFTDELHGRAFAALADADSLHEAVEVAPPDIADLLRRIAVEEPLLVEDPLVDPIDSVVAQLVRGAARRALAELQMSARSAGGDFEAIAVETAAVRSWLDDLDDPSGGREAEDRLVAWLSGRDGTSG